MDNKEFILLLSDTKENLNQLNKMVKDNISAQEHIFDNSFDPLLKQNDGEKKTVENNPLPESNPAFEKACN
jgi:hypothetical protein